MSQESTQYTQAWWEKCRGKVTASKAHTIVYGGLKAWQTYAAKLDKDAETDEIPDRYQEFSGRAAERGLVLEEEAISMWVFETAANISRPDFITSPDRDFFGCSPDFMVESDPRKAGEVKCPDSMEIFFAKSMGRWDKKEYCQVQSQMEATKTNENVFLLYNPDVTVPSQRLKEQIIKKDLKYTDLLNRRLDDFMEFRETGKVKTKEKVFF